VDNPGAKPVGPSSGERSVIDKGKGPVSTRAPEPLPLPSVAEPIARPAAVAPAATDAVAAPPSVEARVDTSKQTAEDAARRTFREQRLKAAEEALSRGQYSRAEAILKPWAEAGVPKAQALLGRSLEERRDAEHSDIEAYSWYALAAHGGEPGALAMRDHIKGKLQPAEIGQAERLIGRFQARPEPAPGAAP
jgi:TPR repeat protein